MPSVSRIAFAGLVTVLIGSACQAQDCCGPGHGSFLAFGGSGGYARTRGPVVTFTGLTNPRYTSSLAPTTYAANRQHTPPQYESRVFHDLGNSRMLEPQVNPLTVAADDELLAPAHRPLPAMPNRSIDRYQDPATDAEPAQPESHQAQRRPSPRTMPNRERESGDVLLASMNGQNAKRSSSGRGSITSAGSTSVYGTASYRTTPTHQRLEKSKLPSPWNKGNVTLIVTR